MDWDWAFTADVVVPRLLNGAKVTILATVLAFGVALPGGLLLMLLRTSRSRIVAGIAGETIEFIRATPLLIQIFFLFFILPQIGVVLPPLATGVLAVGLYNSAMCAEVYRGALQAVPRSQWEAARALNLSWYGTWRNIIIPQMIPPVVPALGNYLIIIFKETPLLSFIAVSEMMQEAKLIGAEYYKFTEAMTIAGLFFLVMSLVSAALIRLIERYITRRVYH